ncbi:MAG: hypothetical protein ACP5FR_00650 [Candidatus Micrarchaeia archaeon]
MQQRNLEAAAIALIMLIASLFVFSAYAWVGPGWDLIAHFLNGRSLDSQSFYACLSTPNCMLSNQDSAIYFEPFRAPLSGAIMGILEYVFKYDAMPIYVSLLFAFFIFSVYYAAKSIGIKTIAAFAAFLSPYLLFYALLPNSTEMLSLSFALIGIGLLYKGRPLAGLAFGFASISKYVALIMLPTLLLLYKPKKIALSTVLFALPVVPWLLVNRITFGNYLFSYTEALSIVSSSVFQNGISASALFNVLSYPAVLGIVLIAFAYVSTRSRQVKAGKIKSSKPRYTSLRSVFKFDMRAFYILILFVALALASYLFIAFKRDAFTQMRFGYMFYGSVALLLSYMFTSLRSKHNSSAITIMAIIAIFVLLLGLYHMLSVMKYTPAQSIVNPIYSSAKATLANYNLEGCRFVTNDWIYMLYLNESAFSPFSSNSIEYSYPVLLFKGAYASTSPDLLINFTKGKEQVFNSTYYSIFEANDYNCTTAAG